MDHRPHIVVVEDEATQRQLLCDYLDKQNFATNFAFFRDEADHHTRLTTANYWTRYGATEVSLWCRLFGQDGETLATWTESCGAPESSIVVDSRDVRARFGLPAFTGQLFIHAVGAAGQFFMARFCVRDGITHVTATPHCNRAWRLLRLFRMILKKR